MDLRSALQLLHNTSGLHFKFVLRKKNKEKKPISDMIKRNELDVGNIGFKILAKTEFKLFCFILF